MCCDGTGNSFDRPDTDSNVAKLYSCLTINAEQIGYYHPGVGTMGAPTSRNVIQREWSRIKGLAFGSGLMSNVADAYRYLMDNYADGDEIFLFGFSRGAYTARVLASVLHVFGLLCAGNHELIPYVLDMYSRRTREAQRKKQTFDTDEAFKWQFSHSNPVQIHFCGLWDTVSSYGWVYDPVQLPFLGRNPIIKTGRHAVSIHERRCYYQDNLWGRSHAEQGQDVRQVWFCGVHSDVGGSYPEKESGLSKIAFQWMIAEAVKAGLEIEMDNGRKVLGEPNSVSIRGLPDYVLPDNNAPLHDSLNGSWWALEILPHRDPHEKKGWYIPLGRKRKIPAGSWIHESVLSSRFRPSDLPPHEVEPWIGSRGSGPETGSRNGEGESGRDSGPRPKSIGAPAAGIALAGALLFTLLRQRK
jgi:uncharacterized protein (DUF2235 family)